MNRETREVVATLGALACLTLATWWAALVASGALAF